MITPELLEKLPQKPMRLMAQLQQNIVEYISTDLGSFDTINSMQEYQSSRQANIRRFNEFYNDQVKYTNNKLNSEIGAILLAVVIGNMLSKDVKEYIPFEQDIYLQTITDDAIKEITTNTATTLENLGFTDTVQGKVRFTPLSPTKYQPLNSKAGFYQRLTDKTANDIFIGEKGRHEAIRDAVKTMTNRGVRTWNRTDGKTEQIDTAIRRHTMTQVKQLSHLSTEHEAGKVGVNTFEVTWHSGHRKSHGWGGRRYSTVRTNEIDKQTGKPFLLQQEMFTLYGGGTLDDWNCRHDIFWIYPFDVPLYSPNRLNELEQEELKLTSYKGKEYNREEARDKQRAFERSMRKWRLEADGFKSAGLKEDYTTSKARYTALRQEYKRFNSAMGLRDEFERVYYDMRGRI